MRYYIADLHFFNGVLNTKMNKRGFASTEEMNEYMIRKWNEKVRPKDEVVVLGDFSYGNAEETNKLLERLHGRIYLIEGNHDHFSSNSGFNSKRFVWVKQYAEMKDNGRKVVLCHYPIMCYNGQYRLDENGNPVAYMLYGHVHNTRDQRLLDQFQAITRSTVAHCKDGVDRTIPCNMINCFCGYSDYTPLSLDEWIECDKKRREV